MDKPRFMFKVKTKPLKIGRNVLTILKFETHGALALAVHGIQALSDDTTEFFFDVYSPTRSLNKICDMIRQDDQIAEYAIYELLVDQDGK